MKVLDVSFLIDYLAGVEATREFYEASGGADIRWIAPVPAYAEVLVCEGSLPAGDIDSARADLGWVVVHQVDERTAVRAGELSDEIPATGPSLDGTDALIVAVGRELDAPIVTSSRKLTHPEIKKIVDIEEY